MGRARVPGMSDQSSTPGDPLMSEELRSRIDQLVEEVAARDQFLAMVSHELRSPVQALLLHLEGSLLLARNHPDPATFLTARVDKALGRVKLLSELIDRFLDVSRIQAGRIDLALDETDLVGLTRAVLARQSDELSWAGCPVTLVAPPAVVGRWDAARLEAVIGNLLSNARKYGAGRPVLVRIEDGSPAQARLAVEDHGPGVPPADQARIFERFERIVSGGPKVSGVGLGLWIARSFVEAHGGTIAVANREGGGAAFTVTLPR